MAYLKVFFKSLIIIFVIIRNSSSQSNDQKVSLAFVFDTTYSMSDELREMKLGVTDVLHRIKIKSDSLQNFIFVPFNNTDFGPVTVDADPNKIQEAIERITLGGNYTCNNDCLKMSIGGIKMAIQSSLPNSYIFVITDASSKDHYLIDVLKIIQEKQSKVVFILTGSVSETGYQAYQRIIEISGGQIFSIDKNQFSQVFSYIETITGEDKINLRSLFKY